MSTEFLDKQFIREFKQTMALKRSQIQFNINMVPLREVINIDNINLISKLVVKDLNDKYLSQLNNTVVDWYKKKTIERNVYWNSGEVKRTETYRIQTGSQLIRTEYNFAIPATYKFKDDLIEYVDYKVDEETGKSYYYYTIPDANLYRANETALVLSERLKPKHYGGIKLINTDGYVFYMYIVPTRKLKAIDSQRIVSTGITVDYNELEAYLVDYWSSVGYIFTMNDLEVVQPIDKYDSTNLAYSIIEPTLEYEPGSDYTIAEESKQNKAL